MASDKEVKIGLTTVANTTGAEQAVKAIDEVVDKGRELEEVLEPKPGTGLEKIPEAAKPAEAALDDLTDEAKEADAALKAVDGKEIKQIPANTAPAIGSIRQLEDEVESLQRELAGIPVGSKAFEVMAGRVNVAQKLLQDAHVEAKKFGATVGRGGSAGQAVLAFSQGFEDAQYGIRGVLNNIPSLVLALGGTGGLAGVLSLAAVAGSLLWEKLGKGSKEAKKDTDDYYETFTKILKVYQDIIAAGKEERDKATKSQADGLQKSLDNNAAKFKLSVDTGDLEAARAKAAAVLKLAEDKLALSRVEAKLVTATGESAVKLSKEREIIIKRIYQDEINIAEVGRKQALKRAGDKVTETGANAVDTAKVVRDITPEYEALKKTVAGLQAEADKLLAERLSITTTIQDAREKIQAIDKSLQNDPLLQYQRDEKNKQRMDAEFLIFKKEKDLAKLEPKIQDKVAEEKASEKHLNDELTPQFEAATKAMTEAAKAQSEATQAFNNLKQTQGIERQSEANLKRVADAGVADQKVETEKTETVEQLDTLVESIGDKGGRDLAPFIAEMKSILQDKALSAEEIERVPVLMSQYFAKIANLGAAQNAAFKNAMGQVDELIRDVAKLKLNQGK